MKIHEYQAKQLFSEYNIPTPEGIICEEKSQIADIVEKIELPVVIKAQVHSGARGKAGGVKIAKDKESAYKIAGEILGMTLVSTQAGAKQVKKILIEKAVDIKQEVYLSITFDRANENIAVIFSTEGGMEIEQVAKSNPEKILKMSATPFKKPDIYSFVKNFGFNQNITNQIKDIIENLYTLYMEKDASLVEINPLVITKDEKVIAIDAKMNFDDNALYKHPEILAMLDESEENPLELTAKENGLNYVKLEGTIGCMVNGAGLAMATMDVIKIAGKNPANFLDVGGGAGSEKIAKAFEILISDSNVKAVFINIFGGILRCDLLAEGITTATKTLNLDIPLIIRLEGTNKEEGTKILNNSNLKFTVVKDLKQAIKVIKEL